MNDRPFVGDIKINRDKYPVGTPLDEIIEFEIWDGEKWVLAATAKDILYNIGSGAGEGLLKLVKDNG